jgi:hypothetical protein
LPVLKKLLQQQEKEVLNPEHLLMIWPKVM